MIDDHDVLRLMLQCCGLRGTPSLLPTFGVLEHCTWRLEVVRQGTKKASRLYSRLASKVQSSGPAIDRLNRFHHHHSGNIL